MVCFLHHIPHFVRFEIALYIWRDMRHLILTLIIFSSASLAFSQHTDIIKLHSSEIVRGKIIEEIPNVSISILALPDSVLRVIPYSDIEQVIYKEGTLAINKSKAVRQSPDGTMKGSISFRSYMRVGYGAQMKENEEFVSNSFYKADLILGASFSDKFSLGLGSGVRKGENDHILVPLFIDMRFSPGAGFASPMVALSFGVNFQLGDDYDIEKFINPEIGIRLGKPTQTNVIFAAGLELFDFVTDRKEPENGVFNIEYTGVAAYQGFSVSILLGF